MVKSIILLSAFFLFLNEASLSGQQPLSMEEAIRFALEHNPSAARARLEIEAAAGRILQAGAIPSADLSFSWGEIPSDFSLSGYGDRSLGISQSFEFPGKRRLRQRAANQDLIIRKENLRRVELLVTTEVKRAYLSVALHEELISIEAEALNRLREFGQMSRIRYASQTVPYLDVLRANLEISRAENRLNGLKADMRERMTDLNGVLGRSDTVGVKIAEKMTYVPFTASFEEVAEGFEADRPSSRIADAFVAGRQSMTSLARKSFLPDFSVGVYSLTLREQPPFNANRFYGTTVSGSWQLDVGMSVPLWFWKQQKGEVMTAKSNERIAEIRRAAVKRRVAASIRSAYASLKIAESQVQSFQKSILKDNRDALESGISLYQNGRLDAMNLLDVYRTYLDIQSEYGTALFKYNLALAELESSGENNFFTGESDEE
jgi:outer membrane protein TolC